MRNYLKLSIFFMFFLVVSIFFLGLSSAVNCWENDANATCSTDSSCIWKSDSWGGWCEDLSCWSLWTQDDCANIVIPNKNCEWDAGGTSFYCTEISCWTFSGTNESACTSNNDNLNCQWSESCHMGSSGGGGLYVDCWSLSTEDTCTNTSGCEWGDCWERGCWDYSVQGDCEAGTDYRGNACVWETSSDSSSSWCTENGCWKYPNQTSCDDVTTLNCEWDNSYCSEVQCWSWDYTNQSDCELNNQNLSCSWDGSWCMMESCWNQNAQAGCEAKSGCIWDSWTSSGWCEEIQCWSWDSWSGGNQTLCEDNAYSLDCVWGGNPEGNVTSGWCYQDFTLVSCANMTTERDCMDTYYCWWQYTDWNDVSEGGTCNDPGWGSGDYDSGGILNDWNPGCYIFDMNETDCNNIIGCEFANGLCDPEVGHDYETSISDNGINCSLVNSSSLCNNIPALASCCSWQGSNCSANKMTTSCWDQVEVPPAESCEDANLAAEEGTRNSNCNQISGYPWYMPCKWDNATKMCGFNGDDVFGNASKSLVKIENKKNCEAAGGLWIVENYCEINATANISIPSGRCEYKFDSEDNCNKACFACELKDSNGNQVNITNARDACYESTLGICEFTEDTTAPNAIGYCNAKPEFKTGVASDCDTDCAACTYMGDPLSNETTKKPNYYCTSSLANSAGGGCKWMIENLSLSAEGGYCLKKGEKTCQESCDRCYTRTKCSDEGRTANNGTSGACKWQGTDDDGNCVANIDQDVEVCWDGIDNNDDGSIDCADVGCYSDTYCGFVEGDCFGWTNNGTCIGAGCEWINDSWNPSGWCDFAGANCWRFDSNISYCGTQPNCAWHNSSGDGWCERDWSIAETCMGLGKTDCDTINTTNGGNCVWSMDTWCQGAGNTTNWCQDYGGWCDHIDFQPKNCWMYQSGSNECNAVSGCNWEIDTYSQPHCEANWSANCWQYYDDSSCGDTTDCVWKTDNWGGWCTNKMDYCWWLYDSESCEGYDNGRCNWREESWGGSCSPACFNSTNSVNSTSCDSTTGCYWLEETGWCNEQSMSACSNDSNWDDSSVCGATDGCRWRDPGWCEPAGGGFSTGAITGAGGVGGSMGAQCYKYDGNETLCTNKTIINISCGWTDEQYPWCDVDWSTDCWDYYSVEGGCNVTNGCWWQEDPYSSTGWCANIMDQCWTNMTLYDNETACNNNTYCNSSSWGGCEPACYSSNAEASCTTSGCRWVDGWCSSSGMTDMFDEMESGGNVPLGTDPCDGSETTQASIDMCGFGMKDMGDSLGFGAGMRDFSNASICNKEKLSSFVMSGGGGAGVGGMGIGGMGIGIMSTSFSIGERVGDGNDTIKFFVYLDSDGSSTGSCSLSHNTTSTEGFEFKLYYASEWNVSTSKAMETFSAYKCDNNDWKVTDIKLNVWKKKMCSEMGGPMIAVSKGDLEKFPLLYSSTSDIRISVASAGEHNNMTLPSDTVVEGWTTPGSIDFEINDVFSYGADVAKFEDILRKGFVEYEDCWDGIDNNNDGNIDCWDYECMFAKVCEDEGVNLANYTDTTSPQVVGVKIEEYPDSALIMYDTTKPSNGTLLFYHNDSNCLSLNKSVYDIGITSDNVRAYKLWHTADVYESTIGYGLTNDTTYYYKLKVCDDVNKCALSKCTSLITSSVSKCGYCNFVTRLKVPTGWNVSYDIDNSGEYEHKQGQVCGSKAGMKTNYTIGRRANIKIEKEDSSVYFEFINVSLTKSGINDKVRTLDTTGDVIGTSAIAGFTSESRDKLINNLHPEVCRVKVPFSGTCETLYHCDDAGENCIDRSTDTGVTLIDEDTCLWQIPYCEFSTYREALPPASGDPASSGGGGGGGGGGSGGTTYSISETQFSDGYTKELGVNDKIKIVISEEDHFVQVISLTSSSATINVSSDPQQKTFSVGDEYKFDVTDDDNYDLSVKLGAISDATKVNVTVKKASGDVGDEPELSPITGDVVGTSETEDTSAKKTPSAEKRKAFRISGSAWLVMILIVVVGLVVFFIWKFKGYKDQGKKKRVKVYNNSLFSKAKSILKTGK